MLSESRTAAGSESFEGTQRSQIYAVIVHPAGRLDAAHLAQFWTEVPALSACTGSGMTAEEAVAATREDIVRWLSWSGAADVDGGRFELIVEPAY